MFMILYVQFFKYLEAIQQNNKRKKIQRFSKKIHSKYETS